MQRIGLEGVARLKDESEPFQVMGTIGHGLGRGREKLSIPTSSSPLLAGFPDPARLSSPAGSESGSGEAEERGDLLWIGDDRRQ